MAGIALMHKEHECAGGEVGFLMGSDSPPGVLKVGEVVLYRVLGAFKRLTALAREKQEGPVRWRQFYPEPLLEFLDDGFLTRVTRNSSISEQQLK
jgi:hypothetical protein